MSKEKSLEMADRRRTYRVASLEDLRAAPLVVRFTGIFHEVEEEHLMSLLPHCLVMDVKKGECLYDQDEPSDNLPLYIVVSGDLRATHIRPDGNEITVAAGSDLILFGDSEMLLADCDPEITRHGQKNRTRARIECETDVRLIRVWPPSAIFDTQAFSIARNLAKIQAVKLLRRNVVLESKTEPKFVPIARYLSRQVRSKLRADLSIGDTTPITEPDIPDEMTLEVTQAQVKRESGGDVSDGTVNNFADVLRSHGCTWERDSQGSGPGPVKARSLLTLRGEILRAVVLRPENLAHLKRKEVEDDDGDG
jgi:CRP-like cAMP-binding protein